MTLAPADPERRAALRSLKLRALVRDGFGVDDASPSPFGLGAALQRGEQGWVLAEDQPRRSLGPALAWARTNGVTELHLLVEDGAGELARRAQPFEPPPAVWQVVGRDVTEAAPTPRPQVEPDEAVRAIASEATALLEAADVDVVWEHGELLGEVRGLEIARVVVDDELGPRLEVGVGRHDREAFAMLHGDLPPEDAIAKVVAAVREQRRPGANPHPLNRLGGERWLRARLVVEPELVGASHLAAVPPVWPRTSVKDVVPAAAVGEDHAGRPLVVVTSTGIDLDLVPEAADVRSREGALPEDARLVLVVPERDAHPVTLGLAASLRHPAEVVPLAGDWRGAPEPEPDPSVGPRS
jgi:hypothetical protein